ncbi:MAG: adenylate/guanylate cyclase domain-containing protein [Chloroflexi bacterium]|nr:adenylate/guanylate cyclase domain-containing protein [Chloroflexota bacterium]
MRTPFEKLAATFRQLPLRLARDRRVRNRLEIGSAIALGAGLLVVSFLLLDFLSPLSGALNYFLFEPASITHPLVEQDRLLQAVMIFLFALLAGATLPHLRFLTAAGVSIIYLLIYLAYAFQKVDAGLIVQPLYPALALALTFAGAMLVRYFAEDRPRAMVDRLFRRNAPPDTIERVVKFFDGGGVALAGVRRMVTVLCIDLRDFDALAETLAPPALVNLVNQYLQMLAAIVFRYEGILIKQSSDTLVAVWNLPLDQFDHALRAVRAAREIRAEARAAAKSKKISVEIGVGIATGYGVAGRMGATPRGEYGIIGDVATLASRFAGKAERGIYLDSLTREQIGADFDSRESNPMRVHGNADPVTVWRIVELVEDDAEAENEASAESV